jgi:hypothetical protein
MAALLAEGSRALECTESGDLLGLDLTVLCDPLRNRRWGCGVDRSGEGNAAMRRQICSLVLGGLLATGVMPAEEPATAPGQGATSQMDSGDAAGHHEDDRAKKLKNRLAHMSKRYKLTAEQQSQIQSILWKEQ